MADHHSKASSAGVPSHANASANASAGWGEIAVRFVTAAALVLVAPPLIYLGGGIGKGVCIVFVAVMAAELAIINHSVSTSSRLIQATRHSYRIDSKGVFVIVCQVLLITAPAILVAVDTSVFGIATTAPSFIVLALALALAITAYSVRHWSALVMAALLAVLLLTAVLLLDHQHGGLLLVIVIGTIALVDTMGYLVGRLVGGIRLIPSISPAKTWSGAIGGLLASPVPLAVYGWVMGGADMVVVLGVIGLVVGVSAIGGDLLESWFKRCHMIKDASQILPGHGGILDRLDGYLLAVPVFYGMLWLVQ